MKRLTEDLSFISGISFHLAAQLYKEYPISRGTAVKIKEQPGYTGGAEMCVHKSKSGGYRLFVRVNDEWMDASLKDIE